MGSDICRWWVECFLTAESVPQEKFCREKMKDCGVTYDVFCEDADAFLEQKRTELKKLEERVVAEKQRLYKLENKEDA